MRMCYDIRLKIKLCMVVSSVNCVIHQALSQWVGQSSQMLSIGYYAYGEIVGIDKLLS